MGRQIDVQVLVCDGKPLAGSLAPASNRFSVLMLLNEPVLTRCCWKTPRAARHSKPRAVEPC